MMRNRWIGPLCLLAIVLFGFAVYGRLPERVPSHWDINGQVNGTMGRLASVLFVPVIGAILLAVFYALPRIDPLRQSYPSFAPTYQLFINLILIFLALVQLGILSTALGWQVGVPRLIGVGIGLLFAGLGSELGRVKPNWFVGIRTPWTLADPEVWRRTHEAGGRVFVAVGVLMALAGLLLPPSLSAYTIIGGALVVAVFSIGYSYFVWRQRSSG